MILPTVRRGLTVTASLLAGCVSGSIAQAQRAVLEAKLNIGGTERLLRAPAKCRAFHSLGAGARVTRQDSDVFEVPAADGERLFLHFPYVCWPSDASIRISGNHYVTLYSVDETPELRITEKKAIPVEDANSKDADVILLSRRVDEDNHESNVRPTADFGRDIVAGAGLTRLQSISTIEFALAFEKLPDAIRQRLGEAKGPIFLDDETDRLFAPLIRPLRLSIDDYPNDLRFWQRQLTNGYSAEEKAFSVNLSRPQRGKRVYYLVAQTYSYRVGTLHSNVPRTIYDPSRRVVYVPVQKWVSYRIPKPLPLNPEVKEDALKGGARSSP